MIAITLLLSYIGLRFSTNFISLIAIAWKFIPGYYLPVKLGEHNGLQYTISIDGEEKPIGVIQGIDKEKDYNFTIGDRVSVTYGYKVRLLPTEN